MSSSSLFSKKWNNTLQHKSNNVQLVSWMLQLFPGHFNPEKIETWRRQIPETKSRHPCSGQCYWGSTSEQEALLAPPFIPHFSQASCISVVAWKRKIWETSYQGNHKWISKTSPNCRIWGLAYFSESLPEAPCMDCCLKFKQHYTKGSSAAQKKYFERDKKTILCFRGHLSASLLLPTATPPHSLHSLGVKSTTGQHLLVKIFHLQFDSSTWISIWLCSVLLRAGRGRLHFFKDEESNSGFHGNVLFPHAPIKVASSAPSQIISSRPWLW